VPSAYVAAVAAKIAEPERTVVALHEAFELSSIDAERAHD